MCIRDSLGAFSFHETKNIISGEGGMLAINDEQFATRAEIIREKGTNRSAFFRGEVDKYGWVDIGSSFLPSEIIAAFLYAQLENLEQIQLKRKNIWEMYWNGFKNVAAQKGFSLPLIPKYATNNVHMFYLVFNKAEDRTKAIEHCKANGVFPVFHYLSLHKSPYHNDKLTSLPNSDSYTDTLLRLPFFYEMTEDEINTVIQQILSY